MSTIGILGAAAVQEDAVLEAQEMGHTVHVLAAAADGPAAARADVFSAVDFSDVDAVADYAARHRLDAVYSTGSDLAVPVSAEVSERLGLPRFVAPQTARTTTDKPAMRRALAGVRGTVPAVEVTAASASQWDGRWPVIVKPADAQGQRGVARVDGPEGLPAAVEAAVGHSRTHRAIIEEFISGPEVSVNGYLVAGRLVFLAVSDRETWPEHVGLVAAHAAPGVAADEAARSRMPGVLEEAAAAIGIADGPVYAQVMLRAGHPYIIEITARLDGCHMWRVLRHAAGVDLMAWTLRHLLTGEAPAPSPDAVQPVLRPVRLDFHCQPPGTVYDPAAFDSPPDSVERREYYRAGDVVRAVNGRFEKVGYDIRVQEPAT